MRKLPASHIGNQHHRHQLSRATRPHLHTVHHSPRFCPRTSVPALPDALDALLTTAVAASSTVVILATALAAARPPATTTAESVRRRASLPTSPPPVEEDDFTWSVVGVVSFIPLFSFTVCV